MKIRLKVALLVGGILPYAILQSWAIIQYRRLQPSNVPLRFQSGQFRSTEFVIRKSGSYHVLIEIDNSAVLRACSISLSGIPLSIAFKPRGELTSGGRFSAKVVS